MNILSLSSKFIGYHVAGHGMVIKRFFWFLWRSTLELVAA